METTIESQSQFFSMRLNTIFLIKLLYCFSLYAIVAARVPATILDLQNSKDVDYEVSNIIEHDFHSVDDCNILIRSGLADPQPVFLKENTEQFFPYTDSGVILVESGKTIEMFCPGKFALFDSTLVTATCAGGTTFKVGGTSYSFKEFVCKAWPVFQAQKTGEDCNGGELVRVGFEVSETRFIKQMEICFNEEHEVTRYVHYTLNPGSNSFQTSVARINFQTAGFFDGKNVDKLYTQVTQKETINAELGYDASNIYWNSGDIYLARGHMAAKADFVYAVEQRASFLFINAAPQWQSFNAGNWLRVEDGVRSYVAKNKIFVDCYTGVYGVTTLPNVDGVETPLYLDKDENNNGLIPVPKIYFRVVIEPASQKGIVFIGVNNPHLNIEQIENDYIFCTDVSSQIDYINWKRDDMKAGYSYACEVDEFVSVVTDLPELSAPGGLLL